MSFGEKFAILLMALLVIVVVIIIEYVLFAVVETLDFHRSYKKMMNSLKNIFCTIDNDSEKYYEKKEQLEAIFQKIISKDKTLSEKFVTIPDLVKYFIASINEKEQLECGKDKIMRNNALQFLFLYNREEDADVLGKLTGTEYSALKKLLHDCTEDKEKERKEDVSQIANELSKKDDLIRTLQFKNKLEKRLSIMNTLLAVVSLIVTFVSFLK